LKNSFLGEKKRYSYLISSNGHNFVNIVSNDLKLTPIDSKFNVDAENVVKSRKYFSGS